MQKLLLSAAALILFVAQSSFANITLPKSAMTYKSAIVWTKDKIISEAKAEMSPVEMNEALKGYPEIVDVGCKAKEIIFIKDTPQCGAINCGYFGFLKTAWNNYLFLGKIDFAAAKFYCFTDKDDFLVTATHETNATSILALYKIENNKLVLMKKLDINLANPKQNDFYEKAVSDGLTEPQLLTGFSSKSKNS